MKTCGLDVSARPLGVWPGGSSALAHSSSPGRPDARRCPGLRIQSRGDRYSNRALLSTRTGGVTAANLRHSIFLFVRQVAEPEHLELTVRIIALLLLRLRPAFLLVALRRSASVTVPISAL